MRIAHIVCTYPPYFGGMGNSAFHMAEELTRLGHEVTVYTPMTDIVPDEDTLATVERVAPSMQYGNGGFFPTITHTLETYDVVHLHYPFFGVAGKIKRWKKKFPHIPLVTSYHMDPRGGGLLGLYMQWYAKWYMPTMLQASDAIIVSTKDFAIASEAGEIYAANSQAWHDIPFGVDTDRFTIDAYSTALRTDWNAIDIPVCLFVGGMDTAHHFKGVPILLKAFRQAVQQRDMRLVLVGDGNERPYFEAIAAGIGLGDRVIFAGRVSDAQLSEYYATADCTILPSTSMAEAFGMVLLESLSCGTPVIASDLPGVREVARIAGMTVPPKDVDALTEALVAVHVPTVLERQRVRDRITAEYTWPAVVRRLEYVYQGLLES